MCISSTALEDLQIAFADIILDDQDLFASEAHWKELVKLLPSGGALDELADEWSMYPNRHSADKWRDVLEAGSGSNKVRYCPCLTTRYAC